MKHSKKTIKNHKSIKYKSRKYKSRKIKNIRKSKTIRKSKKGGFKDGYTCESEGCIFYPSIITNTYDGVTKLYHSERIYNKEKESYNLFEEVDPNFRFHCRIFSSGILTPEQLREKLGREIREIRELKEDKSYFYIDMEYAGTPIGSIKDADNTPILKEALINFMINVMNLRTKTGEFLVHGDPHAGNICYKKDENGNIIIKYIDITNMELVNPETIIKPSTDITRQFSSLMGTLRNVFGFSNKITNELLPVVMNAPERRYEDVLGEILIVLSNNRDTINNDTLTTSASISGFTSPEHSPNPVNENVFAKGIKRMKMPSLYESPIGEDRKFYLPLVSPSKKIKTKLFGDSLSPSPIRRVFETDYESDNDI
jgi:hypothetical protein